jgi:hypothetical protein
MNEPQYKENLVVVVAGYEDQIAQLMAVNPGLSGRFTETLHLKPWTPEMCVESLCRKFCKEDNLIIPDSLHHLLRDSFNALYILDDFQSAREVHDVIYKKLRTEWMDDFDLSPGGGFQAPELNDAHIRKAFAPVIAERQRSTELRRMSAGSLPARDQQQRGKQARADDVQLQQRVIVDTKQHIHQEFKTLALDSELGDGPSCACKHELGATEEQLRMVEEAKQFEMEVIKPLPCILTMLICFLLFAL